MRAPLKLRRPRSLAIAFLVAALVLPAAGLAWSQTYSNNTWFGPGGFNYSSWNSNLNFNEIWWNSSVDRMQLTLCNTSDQCYDYVYDTDGYRTDYRTISYGKAKCQSWSGNPTNVFVDLCSTSN